MQHLICEVQCNSLFCIGKCWVTCTIRCSVLCRQWGSLWIGKCCCTVYREVQCTVYNGSVQCCVISEGGLRVCIRISCSESKRFDFGRPTLGHSFLIVIPPSHYIQQCFSHSHFNQQWFSFLILINSVFLILFSLVSSSTSFLCFGPLSFFIQPLNNDVGDNR